jgi:hypothetical protein
MRRLLIGVPLFALPLVLALTLTLANASVSGARIQVGPSSGSPSTVFVLTFPAPARTARNGSSHRRDMITASAPRGAAGCVISIDVRAQHVISGSRLRVSLDPRKLGGNWCLGVYHGRIEELQNAVCPHGKLCPSHALTRAILGRFTLHVKPGASTGGGTPPPGTSPPSPGTPPPPPGTSPPSKPPPAGTDTTPPTFAGLQSAYYCVGGPQRPAETTPYTLTWQAATDNVTPSSQIVYDIFVAHTSGGEDFSHPAWTTSPGATTYTTPNLSSEGTYFIVRARDQAGNEDQNKVEREGGNLCL